MTPRHGTLVTLALCAVAVALPAAVIGAPTQATTIKASHAWIRVLPGTLPAGGYVTLVNTGATPQALTSASSPDYRRVMLHQSTTHDGMSHMRMVKQIKLPAHATVRLAPGGYHLMLMHARHPVKPGDTVPITLHFADGSKLTVDFKARPANAH